MIIKCFLRNTNKLYFLQIINDQFDLLITKFRGILYNNNSLNYIKFLNSDYKLKIFLAGTIFQFMQFSKFKAQKQRHSQIIFNFIKTFSFS